MTMQAIPKGGYKQQPRRIPRSLGFARYALSFDGADDFVDAGNNASLDVDYLTVEMWFKIDSFPVTDDKWLISKPGLWDAVREGWLFALQPTRVIYFWGQATGGPIDTTFNTVYETGKWYHFVYTYDGDRGKAYVNGLLDKDYDTSNGTIVPCTENRESLLISCGSNSFHGLIDEVRIYNRALSAREVKWNMLNYHNPIRSGLRLWLPMEEGAGEVVYDKSGYGNNGTLLPAGAGPTWKKLRQWELRAAVE